MKKVTLTFPDPNSLWLFKEQSKAINVSVAPRKNVIAGLFSSEEVSLAVSKFQAVQVNINSSSTSENASAIESKDARISKPSLSFGFSHMISLLNLHGAFNRRVRVR